MRIFANHSNTCRLLKRKGVVDILKEDSRCACHLTAETSVVSLYVDVVVDLLVALIGLRMNVAKCFRRPRVEIGGYTCGVSSDLGWMLDVCWW